MVGDHIHPYKYASSGNLYGYYNFIFAEIIYITGHTCESSQMRLMICIIRERVGTLTKQFLFSPDLIPRDLHFTN